MRIYLPATTVDLADEVGLAARRAHAPTPAVVAAHGDMEEGEFHALLAAAADSLDLVRRRLAGETSAAGCDDSPPATPEERRNTHHGAALHRLRVVVAADVDHTGLVTGGQPPSVVQAPPVPWARVVSFHVDDSDDAEGRELLRRAVAGNADAAAAVAQLDLLWYDVSEREHLLQQW